MRRLINSMLATFCGSLRIACTIAAVPCLAVAAEVPGESTRWLSPNGVTEVCVAVPQMAGGAYTDADRAQEQKLCAIDFYDGSHALCPKTFSTSPGTLVYPLPSGPFAGKAAEFERAHCAAHHIEKSDAPVAPVSYKMTMNTPDTSATFAPAALLYYHFSRYFDTAVHVPVAVYRSMDRAAQLERVASVGVRAASASGGSAMNRAGWQMLVEANQNPAAYRPTDELFTSDRENIFGVMLHSSGTRYGEEINGTRESGWGAGQNRDFQETAPFLALRENAPLASAIEQGYTKAAGNATLDKAMGARPSDLQMIFWMQELSEIALLDFIFSQQDRVGNIDYRHAWYWVDDGKVYERYSESGTPPADAAGHAPNRVRRSVINDNDAGGRVPYANFAKTTGMLQKLRHFNLHTYNQLLRLEADFAARGPLQDYLARAFGLSERQVQQVVNNTTAAASIMRQHCEAGELRFDLDPGQFLVHGRTTQVDAACTLD